METWAECRVAQVAMLAAATAMAEAFRPLLCSSDSSHNRAHQSGTPTILRRSLVGSTSRSFHRNRGTRRSVCHSPTNNLHPYSAAVEVTALVARVAAVVKWVKGVTKGSVARVVRAVAPEALAVQVADEVGWPYKTR